MFKAAVKETIPYHTAFVVNPTAGGGKAQRIWFKLEKYLNQAGQSYRSYLTRQTGDGTVLAARAFNERAKLVVAVGGDGTLKELLNGINLKYNILGVIPAGTGKGFIRSCGIPLNWNKLTKAL